MTVAGIRRGIPIRIHQTRVCPADPENKAPCEHRTIVGRHLTGQDVEGASKLSTTKASARPRQSFRQSRAWRWIPEVESHGAAAAITSPHRRVYTGSRGSVSGRHRWAAPIGVPNTQARAVLPAGHADRIPKGHGAGPLYASLIQGA